MLKIRRVTSLIVEKYGVEVNIPSRHRENSMEAMQKKLSYFWSVKKDQLANRGNKENLLLIMNFDVFFNF